MWILGCLDSSSRRRLPLPQLFEIISRIFEICKMKRGRHMRAVLLRDGRLSVGEIADPVPGHGELLLKTLSTAICASDVHFMDHPESAVDDPTGRSLYDPDRDIVM